MGQGSTTSLPERLERKVRAPASKPEIAAERRDFRPPVRVHRHEKHLIIYLITDDEILIVRVLHQSQDVPARLAE